ncbi:MAG: TetR/AcrR family transcriptional regulator [Sphingobacteriales bacterium]|nr:MAG: TetR/AcrR family transcriptional regulator [Sphingobacteriales bacterium]
MAITLDIQLNPNLYLRNPSETKLGNKIISFSIELIEKMGFEEFTFRKLALAINSTEASVYRYFENKHKLLVYLISWYWEWVRFKIILRTEELISPTDKLKAALKILAEASIEDPETEYINETLLHHIVISEGPKAYHTKQVDKENKEGLFLCYKALCQKLYEIILEVNPSFIYPRSLASNLIEIATSHIYYAQHLPRLTDIRVKENDYSQVEQLLSFFAFGLLCPENTGLPSSEI